MSKLPFYTRLEQEVYTSMNSARLAMVLLKAKHPTCSFRIELYTERNRYNGWTNGYIIVCEEKGI